MVLSLWSSPNHVPIKHKGPIKKRNQITPAYHMTFSWRGYPYTICGCHFYPFSNEGISLDSHLLFSCIFFVWYTLVFCFLLCLVLVFHYYSHFTLYCFYVLYRFLILNCNQYVDMVLHTCELKLDWSFCMYFVTFQRVSHVEAKPKGSFYNKFSIGFSQ